MYIFISCQNFTFQNYFNLYIEREIIRDRDINNYYFD